MPKLETRPDFITNYSNRVSRAIQPNAYPASNFPVLELQQVDSGHTRWLLLDASTPSTDTAFTSVPLTGFPPSPDLVTAFVNRIPSESKTTLVGKEDTTTTITNHPPNPSLVGGAVTVDYSVSWSATISATGYVTVANGTASIHQLITRQQKSMRFLLSFVP